MHQHDGSQLLIMIDSSSHSTVHVWPQSKATTHMHTHRIPTGNPVAQQYLRVQWQVNVYRPPWDAGVYKYTSQPRQGCLSTAPLKFKCTHTHRHTAPPLKRAHT